MIITIRAGSSPVSRIAEILVKESPLFYPFQPGAVSEPCNELLLAAGAALTESKVRETKSFLDTVLVDPAGFRKARG